MTQYEYTMIGLPSQADVDIVGSLNKAGLDGWQVVANLGIQEVPDGTGAAIPHIVFLALRVKQLIQVATPGEAAAITRPQLVK